MFVDTSSLDVEGEILVVGSQQQKTRPQSIESFTGLVGGAKECCTKNHI